MLDVRRAALFASAVVLAGAASALGASTRFHLTSSIITPGRSIGNVTIGMTVPRVTGYLGEGQLLTRHPVRVAYYLYGNRASGEYTVLFTGHPRTAVAIGERTGVMHTASGIRVGSSLAEVKAAYPVQCDTSVKEAATEPEATGLCDLSGPAGRATRFGIQRGEVETIGVAESGYLSQLK
jgi:hypothetical protein